MCFSRPCRTCSASTLNSPIGLCCCPTVSAWSATSAVALSSWRSPVITPCACNVCCHCSTCRQRANALSAPYNRSLEHIVRCPLVVRISHSLCDAHGVLFVMQHLTELYRKLKAAGRNGAAASVVALDTAAPQRRRHSANFRAVQRQRTARVGSSPSRHSPRSCDKACISQAEALAAAVTRQRSGRSRTTSPPSTFERAFCRRRRTLASPLDATL